MSENFGKLIVIEGLDGSGKATQTQLLLERLEREGYKAMKVSFPDYDSQSSALVKMYLNKEFGEDPEDVNAYAASSFYAVDRYASFKKNWKSFFCSGGIIAADRYTTSNAIHQCCKLPRQEWDSYLKWLFSYEYEYLGIPKPDKVFFLKADVSLSQKLISSRYEGDETQKDIHEGNVDYLKKAERAAVYCADKYNWEIIKCQKNGQLRTPLEIHEEIYKKLSMIDGN